MLFLLFVIPVIILLGITIYIDKKNKGRTIAPDVNRGNQNIETETFRNQFHDNGSGGDGGSSN